MILVGLCTCTKSPQTDRQIGSKHHSRSIVLSRSVAKRDAATNAESRSAPKSMAAVRHNDFAADTAAWPGTQASVSQRARWCRKILSLRPSPKNPPENVPGDFDWREQKSRTLSEQLETTIFRNGHGLLIRQSCNQQDDRWILVSNASIDAFIETLVALTKGSSGESNAP